MSDAKSPQNLSMDEILATIRRIIAEDEHSSSTPGSTSVRGVPAAAQPAPVPPAPVPDERAAAATPEMMQAAARAPGADGVLDLTDALNEDGSVRRLAPPATASGAPEAARTPPFAERAAEMAAAEAKPADAGPNADRGVGSGVDPGVGPGPTSPAATPCGETDAQLVSDVAASASAAAFGRLAAAPRARQEPALVGDRPLDEIVRDLLRPLLRSWLNENLPGIVERLVQAEIAKISARSEPG